MHGKWTVGELEGCPQEAERRAGMRGDPSISKVPTWLFCSVTPCVSLIGATRPASHIQSPVSRSAGAQSFLLIAQNVEVIKVCGPRSHKCVLASVIVPHADLPPGILCHCVTPSPFLCFKVSQGQPSVGNQEIHITTSTFCQALSGLHCKSLRST